MPSQFFPKQLPSVNELLESPQLRKLLDQVVTRNAVTTSVRSFLDNLRTEVQQAAADIKIPTPSELADRIAKWITNEEDPTLQPAINATGTLLHSGLGQVPLAVEAIEAIAEVSRRLRQYRYPFCRGRSCPANSGCGKVARRKPDGGRHGNRR